MSDAKHVIMNNYQQTNNVLHQTVAINPFIPNHCPCSIKHQSDRMWHLPRLSTFQGQ